MRNSRSTLQFLAAGAFVLGLYGCAKAPGALVSDSEKPTVNKISVLSVTSPAQLYTENKSLLIGVAPLGVIQKVQNWQNSKDFTVKMEEERSAMGEKMTAFLVEALEKEGFQTNVIDGPKGPPGDPENVDYKKLATTGLILHFWFNTVGMYSGPISNDYIPRVNTTAYLLYANNSNYLYNDSLYYGADSRGEAYWSIPADPKYKFANFPAMVEKSPEVAKAYDLALQKTAAHLAREFRKKFRTESAK
jgi:hypothetical protein